MTALACGTYGPQWSPSLADGTTPSAVIDRVCLVQPQWSPSLADGTTRLPLAVRPQQLRAAMEPVLGGRDDSPAVR